MTTRRARAADVCFGVGGAALLSAALLRWVRRGPGATLRGHDLIDTVARLAHHAQVGRPLVIAVTIGWYCVPAAGAMAWVVVGFSRPKRIYGRLVTALSAASTTTAVALLGTRLHWTNVSFGAYAAIIGTVLLLAGTTIDH